MKRLIGIRREDKSPWERRVPLIPEDVRQLKDGHSIEVSIQPSEIRVFSNQEYLKAGAKVEEDLSGCQAIFALKEVPLEYFQPGKTYLFFSHTIKGQPYNLSMLRRLLELKCQLIDYETVTDNKGRRLLFFGRHAGMAGMIDTLWTLGKRLDWEGIPNPFSEIHPTHRYESLAQAKTEIARVGRAIESDGLPDSLTPLICGLTGYGNVSKGAQEILDILPVREIAPQELDSEVVQGSAKLIYKVVFREEHTVEPVSPKGEFELADYYGHPDRYRSRFESYLPHLTVLVNCIYWESKYPRLVTKEALRRLYGQEKSPCLRVIGDISADIEGAMECTVRHTSPDDPVFTFDPFKDLAAPGWQGVGPVVLAVDNLPCQLPKESSIHFSQSLLKFVPDIARADFSADLSSSGLPPSIQRGAIVYRGELTPDYHYLEKFL